MNAFVIDAFEFCRLKEQRDGEIAIADLPRLAEESVDKAGVLQWSLQGGANQHGHAQIILSVSGEVNLVCQRCLTPMPFDIASHSTIVLAPDEKSADEIDAQLVDEPVEVVVGSRSFNIALLVEDEALLAIPLSPKHEVCPAQSGAGAVGTQAEPDAEKVSPFAVLKNLKK